MAAIPKYWFLGLGVFNVMIGAGLLRLGGLYRAFYNGAHISLPPATRLAVELSWWPFVIACFFLSMPIVSCSLKSIRERGGCILAGLLLSEICALLIHAWLFALPLIAWRSGALSFY
jgi:hypothetical protein